MAVRARRNTRRRPWGTILVLTVLAVALGWVLVPLSRGEPVRAPLAFVNDWLPGEVLASEKPTPADEGPGEGRVRVLVSGRIIPAYAKVVRDDLWVASKGTFAFVDIDEDVAKEGGVLIDVTKIVGRVMAHQKQPGYAFTENDFLPEGTRPGVAGGVPPGKRALRIEVDKVEGIVGLQPGDRFDMVAASPLDTAPASSAAASFVGPFSDQMRRQTELGTYRRARVQVLVQNGVVVTPLQTRAVPVTSTTLTQGQRTRTIPVQEMVIALDPAEVAPFLEALSVEADITCLARSGHPDDPLDSVTPSSDPSVSLWGGDGSSLMGLAGPWGQGGEGSFSVVESIQDGERTLVPVPRSAPEEQGR